MMIEDYGDQTDRKNEIFNRRLEDFLQLRQFTNLMFFVCNGNHDRVASMNHIDSLHKDEITQHFSIDSIILDTKGRIVVVMQVMCDINK